MFPKNKAYKLAERLGAQIEWDQAPSLFTIHVHAPAGKHWKDGDVHSLRIEARAVTALQRDDCWIDAINRMGVGLVECDLNEDACADAAGMS